MQVETLGVARSLGWKVHMRCANGYRQETRSMRRASCAPLVGIEGSQWYLNHRAMLRKWEVDEAVLSGGVNMCNRVINFHRSTGIVPAQGAGQHPRMINKVMCTIDYYNRPISIWLNGCDMPNPSFIRERVNDLKQTWCPNVGVLCQSYSNHNDEPQAHFSRHGH
jgi:hypothetical protein